MNKINNLSTPKIPPYGTFSVIAGNISKNKKLQGVLRMGKSEVGKRIESLKLPKGKGLSFIQAYDSGLDLISKLAEEGNVSAIRLYIHLIKIMDRSSGAAMTDIKSIIADTGLSRSAVYRSITALKEAGHLRCRVKQVYEINPEGFWGGYADGKKNALFMAENSTVTKGVRFRLNAGASHKKGSFTLPATFEPVDDGKKPSSTTFDGNADSASLEGNDE